MPVRLSVRKWSWRSAFLAFALLTACSGGSGGSTGNTELNLDIVNPGGTSGELGFSIDRVDYRITCAGGGYILPPYAHGPAGQNGDPCSLDDLDTNGIPDVCPPGSNYIAGTAGPDNIVGTNQPDCIFGMAGDDVIDGVNGQDYICGGAGNDQISSGNSDDVLVGGDGDDVLDGGNGNDSLDGGPGVDTLDGASGSDTCVEEVPGTLIRLTACEQRYSDSVDISGAFEVVDTRVPPVWQAVMDLPPGDCTITLSVFEDDELVCVGSQTLLINEDGTTKYDIVLVCSLSIDLPDGMADVDGTFEFITGNLCPKLYVLNAIPSVIGLLPKTTEVQYRAKDPDNSCGNNCDPQTCDFSNPPVCSPYPSNINDPACNPALGGDPNSVDCQAGVHAGLVCTIGAFPSSSIPPGLPGGTFLSPLDGVTPVGPILPVNLNTAAGVPGVILPGLGGPAGTNAANSPAYPPGPNHNGSLPPLVYRCSDTTVGQVVINLDCSDGDAECDQNKQIIVTCPGIDYLCDPNFCDGGGECLTDGICDLLCNPACDPTLPSYDAVECCSAPNPGDSCGGDECVRCPGQDISLPDGTLCSLGACLGGTCVECAVDADCANNPAPPIDCQTPNTCVANSCVAGGTAPAGTVCSNGLCDGSGTGSSDPPCNFVLIDPPLQTAGLDMGCTNNVTADISILPYSLDVDPDGTLASTSTPATFGGIAEFSEVFLDAAQGAVPGGVTQADLISLVATVQIRTGGTLDAPVALSNPPLATTCLIGGAACDPANNVSPSVPGTLANTDCVPTGTFNPCQALVGVPVSSDCTVGGACDLLGKKVSQCDLNGFCVTGGLPLALDPVAGSFTPAASGIVNFGFADQGTGATVNPNGTYALPAAVFTAPTALNEIKVNASGLSVALVCTMAVDAGGPDGPVPPVPDQASPTPSSLLNTFNIQVP